MDLLNIDLPDDASSVGSDQILEQNLLALQAHSPQAVESIRQAEVRRGIEFVDTQEDGLGLVVDSKTLASRRRPITEAERLVDTVDLENNAAVCVLGFAAGHHCRLLSERMKGQGVLFCFEPDTGLLRALLSRVDLTGWLSGTRFVLITEGEDRAAISRGLDGLEGVIAMGVTMVDHPASRVRLKESAPLFVDRFTEVLRATRTSVTTALLQSTRTLRNLLMNLDRYAGSAGILDLKDAANDRPAVLVAAGPSLHRNLDRLAADGVRDRVVIIAAQTVLKPMLARGIRPHIVTALDYHEISTRFYEGLTAEDVQGVTLVADPKVNPAVLSVWPGELRLIGSDLLDGIMGAQGENAQPHGELKAGATVAHLSHYLARHLGCDPVILIGQDLAFTDGVYYGPGAAIHEVWSAELGPFRTLEQLEWERIARHKNLLRPATDIHGQPVFTDEQLASYLAQFEVDFAEDEARGLRVIDATEGGVRKKRTEVLSLHEALDRHATETREPLPRADRKPDGRIAALGCVGKAREQAQRIAERSRTTAGLLTEMLEHHRDHRRVNGLITRIQSIRDEVLSMQPGWQLIEFINQSGVLGRIKADRRILMQQHTDPIAKQRQQIERDLENVTRLSEAGDHLTGLLEQAQAMLDGSGPRLTRDTACDSESELGVRSCGRVEALIPVDCEFNGLGTRRDLQAPVWRGDNALRLTVGRLLLSEQLDGMTLLTGEPDRVRDLLGHLGHHDRVSIERVDGDRIRQRTRALGRARLFGSASWRGGLGGLTCYDEAFDPAMAIVTMERRSIDACVVVGADWSLVVPELIDEIVSRHREAPEQVPVVFTQAAPGLGGMLLDRKTVARLAKAQPLSGIRATLGGLMNYHPASPASDPIATHACVGVEPVVRDCGSRAIADSSAGVALVASVIAALDQRWIEASAATIAGELIAGDQSGSAPMRTVLEACTGRLSRAMVYEPIERPVLSMPAAHRVMKALGASRSDTALTLGGAGDPLAHPGLFDLIQLAEECGVGAVHVRTELLHEIDLVKLIDAGPAVISVDLHARTPEAYRAITGVDRHAQVHQRLEELLRLAAVGGVCGLPRCWVVPRLTKGDRVLTEIPDWYDGVLAVTGAAVIDPAPAWTEGSRITRITPPRSALTRLAREELLIESDLNIPELGTRLSETLGLGEAWRRVVRARRSAGTLIEAKAPATTTTAAA